MSNNNDISIAPVFKFDPKAETQQVVKYDPRARLTPTYLVKTMDGTFVATKYDDTAAQFGKFVGFYTNIDHDIIQKEFQELIKSMDKALYMEMIIPWHRIISVQSLIFRFKQ